MELGPYALVRPLGRGGMGEVWRARGGGADVALKVLTTWGRDERRVRALHREVRAVAMLHHRHIVRPLDVGLVSDDEAAASEGRFLPGNPWFAMELADGGSLRHAPPLPWPRLREVLLALSSALAHAHARGVVHRDLKPANLLLANRGDAPPDLRLADFGISAAMTSPGDVETVGGTPAYMAPEQFAPDAQGVGPWTDLYALGAVAFALATGRPPFRGSPQELMDLHRHGALPRLETPHPFPSAFEGWVRGLMSKDAQRRPPCAATAALALRSISGSPRAAASAPAPPPLPDDVTTLETNTLRFAEAPRPLPEIAACDWPRPSLPAPWPSSAEETDATDQGLGLVGLRPAPLVGRRPEGASLDEAFERVVARERPEAVLLTGPLGIGKTHLTRWLAHRLEEAGAARAVWLRHAAEPTDGDRPADAVALALRRASPQPLDLARRLLTVDGQTPEELDRLLRQPQALPGHRRHHLLARLITAWSRDRPVVLCIDDAQWAAESLRWVQTLLEQDDPATVLVVLALRDGELEQRPLESRLLDELAVDALPLGPLSDDEQRQLIRQLLGLRVDAAEQIASRSQGHPAMTVALVQGWAAERALVPSGAGYRLDDAEPLVLPPTLIGAWRARLEQLLAARVNDDARALTVAAALGQRLRDDDWRAVCDTLDVAPSAGLLLAVHRAGLIELEASGEGWSWTSSPAREAALLDQPLAEVHRAIADRLEPRWRAGEHDLAERVGRHRLAAEQRQEAMEPLDDAYRQLHRSGDIAAKIGVLRGQRRALGAGDLSQRIAVATRMAGALAEVGDLERALEHADEARALAERDQQVEARARALHIEGSIRRSRLELARAAACFSDAMAPEVSTRGRAMCLLGRGIIEAMQGRLDVAEATLHLAKAEYARVDPIGAWFCRQAEAYLARSRGDLDEAERGYVEAQRGFEEHNMQMGVGFCLDGRGDVARARGNHERAAELLRQAIALLERIGSGEQTPHFNLATTLLAMGERSRAEALAARALRVSRRRGHRTAAVHMQAVLFGCALARADGDEAAQHLSDLTAAVDDGYLRLSVAETLELVDEGDALLVQGRQLAQRIRDGLAPST